MAPTNTGTNKTIPNPQQQQHTIFLQQNLLLQALILRTDLRFDKFFMERSPNERLSAPEAKSKPIRARITSIGISRRGNSGSAKVLLKNWRRNRSGLSATLQKTNNLGTEKRNEGEEERECPLPAGAPYTPPFPRFHNHKLTTPMREHSLVNMCPGSHGLRFKIWGARLPTEHDTQWYLKVRVILVSKI